MDCNKEDASRCKEIAEKKFTERDIKGCQKFASKAYKLDPGFEGMAQMLATIDIHLAAQVKINGVVDHYAVLQLNPWDNLDTIKKQYRKLALLIHPDKNRSVGAEGAFSYLSEAWNILSDSSKRSLYDHKRTSTSNFNLENFSQPSTAVKTDVSSGQMHDVNGFYGVSNAFRDANNQHQKPRTFWTSCGSCHMRYEYLRKYLNKKLSCQFCKTPFLAIEMTYGPPTNSSNSNSSFTWSFACDVNGRGEKKNHKKHGDFGWHSFDPRYNGSSHGMGSSGFQSKAGKKHCTNLNFQWSPFSGVSSVHGVTTTTSNVVQHGYGKDAKAATKKLGKRTCYFGNENFTGNMDFTWGARETLSTNPEGAGKRWKNEGDSYTDGYEEGGFSMTGNGWKVTVNPPGPNTSNTITSKKFESVKSNQVVNGTANGLKKSGVNDSVIVKPPDGRQVSMAPAFDARQLLINKARAEIRNKLEEMRLGNAKPSQNQNTNDDSLDNTREDPSPQGRDCASKKQGLVMDMNPCGSNFHDFGKIRSEECFRQNQIWALYDRDDGMPRLYGWVQDVISLKPFKVCIRHLYSKSCREFDFVRWVDLGFAKTCGSFRAGQCEVIENVKVFSHVVCGEKGRKGFFRICPRKGDVWALYRHWSSEWDESTQDEVRRQYDLVEVLDDYVNDGVCVFPLDKVVGFKNIFGRNPSHKMARWIPKKEMLRFSHQVPSLLLRKAENTPDGCRVLDPAATPLELLHVKTTDEREI
ncbi:hypothetical protein AMTRI_Chr10g227430 [Amborella trichopoda]|uniref:J domain-containing protein n=1 Tax=Amborella trichopoda TaxID=13333 RepID=W1PTJ5_AMBTC|nr:uncharacterized protein LOC18438789 [Amborella trichopoda]ERN10610.1 hypothetical protein AMTR_s00028p00152320 [Amborella trichopoda]|eukprot:XP_006849029.1 uncharacterized protein LOC18438789 [Amborella trichopoda]